MASEQLKAAAAANRSASHGRGGAGNINNKPQNNVEADDLKTPTIKSGTYTTGRGGSGNMATNSSSEESRRAQDVDTPAHHQNEPKGTYHWGRGGEGNMMTVGGNGTEKKKARTSSRGEAGKTQRSGSFQTAVDKGKEMLGLKGKADKNGESAIED